MTNNKRRTLELMEALKGIGFHSEDVEFDDGYFIFEHGEDSVVRFHVKECPYWLFGIWWSKGGESLDFFAQYEREIDKFKPASSIFVEENIDWSGGDDTLRWSDISKILKYIHKHPFKAWKVHTSGGSKIWEAEWGHMVFWEYVSYSYTYYHQVPQTVARLEKQFCQLLTHIGEDLLIDYKIVDYDMGSKNVHSIPRYALRSNQGYTKKTRATQKLMEEVGEYGIPMRNLSDETLKELLKYKRSYDKYAKKYGTYYFCHIDPEYIPIEIREGSNE